MLGCLILLSFNSDIQYTSTMSAVEVKKAQNNLTCPVCYQLFKNPKYLPCYHSYCEGCLEKMQVQCKIICPECRKEVKVPAGGVKELATDFSSVNRLVDDGRHMASFVAEQVGEAKLSVAINGEQIKGSPYSIVVGRNYQAIDKPSKIVNNNGSMGGPWGIAFGRNGLWAVADWTNHCVYIFDDKDQLVGKFGNYGSNNGQFTNPRGVAFDNHNHLYVVDNGNNRVQKFDTNGNYLLQFGNKGSSDGELNNPCGITVHCDKVYIADYGNKQISVFQTNGKFYTSFGSDLLGNPTDVVVSADNHLLIADYNSCICTFTLDGHYVGKFGTPGSGEGQLECPYSLTTDLNGCVIVADTNNHRVSVFDNHGDWIHHFGSSGAASGQLDTPDGIALGPDGNIYVCDTNNNRIQIYNIS